MIMNVHSDASYLSESEARSRACGHFFMGWSPKDGDPIRLNGAFFTLCAILRFVIASAAKAELGALFLNCKEGMIFCMALEELGHPQPKTQVHFDNAMAVGIANNTVKRQHLRSMEMRYFWVCNKIAQDAYDVKWHPGQENLADYQSKHHTGAHHQAVRPWYLHESTSPLVLPRATRPSTLKGCVGTLPEGYVRNVPLPRVPNKQSTTVPHHCRHRHCLHKKAGGRGLQFLKKLQTKEFYFITTKEFYFITTNNYFITTKTQTWSP